MQTKIKKGKRARESTKEKGSLVRECVYLKNYRGFREEIIEIYPVTFLVGENSTGKSSLLEVLNLMRSEQLFWSVNPFAELGHVRYSDLSSDEASSFTIGSMIPGDGGIVDAIIIEYASDQGIPVPRALLRVSASSAVFVHTSTAGRGFKLLNKTNRRALGGSAKELVEEFEGLKRIPIEDLDSINESSADRADSPARLFDLLFEIRVQSRDLSSGFMFPHARNVDSTWIAPIRSKPKRTYDDYPSDYSPEGEHTPFLLKHVLEVRGNSKEFRERLQRIGTSSGLFQGVEIRSFGNQPRAPFELDVSLNGNNFSVKNVGYGVAQSLPILAELLLAKPGQIFAIQQPEVHLHPKAQAQIGELIFEVASEVDCTIVVETHSDYLIDRFRLLVRGARETDSPAALAFFTRDGDGNHCRLMPVSATGEITNQPEEYREFFLREEMALLGIPSL